MRYKMLPAQQSALQPNKSGAAKVEEGCLPGADLDIEPARRPARLKRKFRQAASLSGPAAPVKRRVTFAKGPFADRYGTQDGHARREGTTAPQRRQLGNPWPVDLTPANVRMLEAVLQDTCVWSLERLKRRAGVLPPIKRARKYAQGLQPSAAIGPSAAIQSRQRQAHVSAPSAESSSCQDGAADFVPLAPSPAVSHPLDQRSVHRSNRRPQPANFPASAGTQAFKGSQHARRSPTGSHTEPEGPESGQHQP
ncbi:hypothetical protein WJX84_009496 [Apatococcus fuscideae]|uniref:Uncharacterized protein n=1 Tax=Apatococcus fuscideae TaxID=2026836 RepID=A0AAW1S7X7_9CHLO